MECKGLHTWCFKSPSFTAFSVSSILYLRGIWKHSFTLHYIHALKGFTNLIKNTLQMAEHGFLWHHYTKTKFKDIVHYATPPGKWITWLTCELTWEKFSRIYQRGISFVFLTKTCDSLVIDCTFANNILPIRSSCRKRNKCWPFVGTVQQVENGSQNAIARKPV